MKVNRLFKKYYKILNEQDPSTPENLPAETSINDIATEPIPALKPNEIEVINLLKDAFIFNPDDFRSQKNAIEQEIQLIRRSKLLPIPQLIEKIKRLINKNPYLKESKTLQMFSKYIPLFEAPADATEPQQQQPTPEPTTNNSTPVPQPPTATTISMDLKQKWPEYRELLCRALEHSPKPEEIIMLTQGVEAFGEADPAKLVVMIKDLLASRQSTVDLEKDLANA